MFDTFSRKKKKLVKIMEEIFSDIFYFQLSNHTSKKDFKEIFEEIEKSSIKYIDRVIDKNSFYMSINEVERNKSNSSFLGIIHECICHFSFRYFYMKMFNNDHFTYPVGLLGKYYSHSDISNVLSQNKKRCLGIILKNSIKELIRCEYYLEKKMYLLLIEKMMGDIVGLIYSKNEIEEEYQEMMNDIKNE